VLRRSQQLSVLDLRLVLVLEVLVLVLEVLVPVLPLELAEPAEHHLQERLPIQQVVVGSALRIVLNWLDRLKQLFRDHNRGNKHQRVHTGHVPEFLPLGVW
jgi:hypothetical protein